MEWKFILFAFGIIIGLGLIAGGGVLCWQSNKHNTCYDWQYESPYYPLYDCGLVSSDLIAMSKCDTQCYCSYYYQYTCLNDTPHTISPSFIGWGISLIIVGVIIIVVSSVFIHIFRKSCC